MVRIIIALLFCFPVAICAQTYQQLSEKAIECIENDSLSQAEELLIKALKLEPKNGKNALLFSNLGLVQRRLGEFDKALESYSFALNFAPLAVPILLDRAAIYMEMGKNIFYVQRQGFQRKKILNFYFHLAPIPPNLMEVCLYLW